MIYKNTILSYSLNLLLSTGKKTFATMGRELNTSGYAIKQGMQHEKKSILTLEDIAQTHFKKKKKLYFVVDDTLIKKPFSQWIQGTGWFFDTKQGRRTTALRPLLATISDGSITLPFDCDYLVDKDLLDSKEHSFLGKNDLVKLLYNRAKETFSQKEIVLIADGLFASKEIIDWCITNKVKAEMRMHSNRVVVYKGKKQSLKALAFEHGIQPKGRQMARTITASWHGMELEFTVVRRLDKHDQETIVFQVATYKAKPIEHVEIYKKRWSIEMMIRTCKQRLGMQDNQSTSFQVQRNHIAASLLSYALAQLARKKHKLTSPEEAISRSELQNTKRHRSLFSDF